MRIDQRLFSLLIIILAGSSCESRLTTSSLSDEAGTSLVDQEYDDVSDDQNLNKIFMDMNAPEEDMDQISPTELDAEANMDQFLDEISDATMDQLDLSMPPAPLTPETEDDVAFIYDQDVVHTFYLIIS